MPGAVAVEVGEWVASANPAASLKSDSMDEPFAVGVISVNRRRIPGSSGFLGVSMMDVGDAPGAKIMQVIPGSAAEKAGVRVDDLITSVNNVAIANRNELSTAMQRLRPGDLVTITVERGDQTLTLRATLGVYTEDSPEEEMEHLLMGSVSQRSGDFPAVYQHDTVIRPVDCGGPIVDLEGHVLGINIARAGRTETYALPADLIVPLIEPMKTGKMPPPGQTNFAGTTKPAATQRE
jgi:serine protease Do